MAFPKMILEINLIDANKIGIKLKHVTVSYNRGNSGVNLQDSNIIQTKNGWTFMVTNYFGCNGEDKIFTIPCKDSRATTTHTDILVFGNNDERYKFLKNLKDALLQWSDNNLFLTKHRFTKTPHIRYEHNTWTIF